MIDIENELPNEEETPKKKKQKKNSKKRAHPITLFARLRMAGSKVRNYVRDNPSEILLTTIAILMLDVEGSLDSIEDWSEDFSI